MIKDSNIVVAESEKDLIIDIYNAKSSTSNHTFNNAANTIIRYWKQYILRKKAKSK